MVGNNAPAPHPMGSINELYTSITKYTNKPRKQDGSLQIHSEKLGQVNLLKKKKARGELHKLNSPFKEKGKKATL